MKTKKQFRKYRLISSPSINALLITLIFGVSCHKIYASIPLVCPVILMHEESLSTQDTIEKEQVIYFYNDYPSFPGGNVQKWIAKNIKYPAEAIEKNIQGKVYVQFVIEKDGSITEVKVIRGVDPLLDAEAVRVVNNMPKWKPGTERGKPARISYTLPVNFFLPKNPKPQPQEDRYTSYLKDIEKIEQKMKDPSLLTESDKTPIGKKMLEGETNNKKAYKKMLEWANTAATPSMIQVSRLMDSLNFSADEKNTVIAIYRKYVQNNLKFLQAIGPKDFIQKFSATPSWEYAQLMLGAQVELKNSLTPERYKQLVLGTYLKSQPQQDLFMVVEDMPSFPGSLQNWIAKNIHYPESAIKNKIGGKVFTQFIIEKDGSVSGAKILRGVSPDLDQEALRLINSMPKWKPGHQKGKAVRVAYTLPIYFHPGK